MNNEDSRLKIGWVIDGEEGYGLASTIIELGRHLMARDVSPIAFSLRKGSFQKQLESEGWRTVTMDHISLGEAIRAPTKSRLFMLTRSFRTAAVASDLVAEARTYDLSALVTRSAVLLPLLGMASKQLGCPSWWYMASAVPVGLKGLFSRLYYRMICYWYGVEVMANSKYTHGTIFPQRQRGIVLPVIIDMDVLNDAAEQETVLPEVGSGPVFLMAARLVSWKGQLEFVRAFLRVIQSGEKGTLLLAGGGDSEYSNRVRRLIESSGAGDRVRLLGRRNDIPALMRWVDVVVSPSVTPEPFGRVCVEAQGVGTPVLATALGGPTETVVDGETGWLIQTPSVDAMEEGIRRCLSDRPRWPQMGEAGRLFVRRHYDGKTIADAFVAAVLPTLSHAQKGFVDP